MNRTDEYWAGFLDGDGHFGLLAGGRNKRMQPRVVVDVACEETIRLLHEDMGMGSYNAKRSPSIVNTGRRDRWCYKASSKESLAVTQRLYPWLCDHAENARKILDRYDCEYPEAKPRGLHFFAGLFDAEGSCSMLMNQGKRRPVISLKMGNETLVREIHAFIGEGRVFVEDRSHISSAAKTMFDWRCTTQSACRAILKLSPYLIYQRERAQPILDYAT